MFNDLSHSPELMSEVAKTGAGFAGVDLVPGGDIEKAAPHLVGRAAEVIGNAAADATAAATAAAVCCNKTED